MDIFEWIFRKRSLWETKKELSETSSIKSTIKFEINRFNRLWNLHKEKVFVNAVKFIKKVEKASEEEENVSTKAT